MAITSIFLRVPLINCLTFRQCLLTDSVIDVSCTSLEEPGIDDCLSQDVGQEINISCPNLLSLIAVGFMDHLLLNFIDVSSLVEVKVDFEMGLLSYNGEEELLKHLIQTLRHVNKLTVGIWCH